MKDRELIKILFKIIKTTEKEVKQIYDDSSLEKPIQNDVVLSKRNMAYNQMKTNLKAYKKAKEKEREDG